MWMRLPGINIILAKKIVKYRDEQGDFKSNEDFYEKMKIKSHFRVQLEKRISVYERRQNKTQNTERIIDF